MARKRSDNSTPSSLPDEGVEAPETHSVYSPASDGSADTSGTPANKTEAVKMAMAAGVQLPVAVTKYVKEHFDIEITPAHVSTIKGNIKKEQGNGQAIRKRGRKPRRQEVLGNQDGQVAEKPFARSASGGLSPQDLGVLADIIKRAGGLEQLQEFLTVLQRMR